jgi:hypothetical protein
MVLYRRYWAHATEGNGKFEAERIRLLRSGYTGHPQ